MLPLRIAGLRQFALTLAAWGTLSTGCLVFATDAGKSELDPPSADDAAGNMEGAAIDAEVQRLVQDLGASSYAARQRAMRRLMALGTRIHPFLAAALESPDAEIRHRAMQIRETVERNDLDEKLDGLLNNPRDDDGKGIPGWERFRQQAGNDNVARECFVKMFREERRLMSQLNLPAEDLARELKLRMEKSRPKRTRNRGRIGPTVGRVRVSNHAIAAMIFAATDPRLSLDSNSLRGIGELSLQSPFVGEVKNESLQGPLKKIVQAWIRLKLDDPLALSYQMQLGATCNLADGLVPAIAILQSGAAEPATRAMALITLAKLGGMDQVHEISRFLDDGDVVGKQATKELAFESQVRDIALALLVRITKQEWRDYGLKSARPHPNFILEQSSIGFNSDDERQKALEKWKAWAKENL